MEEREGSERVAIEGVVALLEQAEPEAVDFVKSWLESLNANRFWSEVTGPCLTQIDTATLLGVTDTTVLGKPGLLRVRDKNDRPFYPVFQFDGPRQKPGVEEVVKTLAGEFEPLTIAAWLRSPKEDLDQMTPMQAIEKGEVPAVVLLARRVVQHSR